MNPETWLLAHAQQRDELIARARDHRCFASLAAAHNRGRGGLRRALATLIETARTLSARFRPGLCYGPTEYAA